MLTIIASECDCIKCSQMCHAPCCGTPDDMKKIIDGGFGSRLMYDDWPDGEPLLKPALKGFEGKRAPWQTDSWEGCTFWKNGKCELHPLGLKPIQGKLAHHDHTDFEVNQIGDYIGEEWKDEKGNEVIKKWKELNEI